MSHKNHAGMDLFPGHQAIFFIFFRTPKSSIWNHMGFDDPAGPKSSDLNISNPVHWIKSEDDSVLGALLQG